MGKAKNLALLLLNLSKHPRVPSCDVYCACCVPAVVVVCSLGVVHLTVELGRRQQNLLENSHLAVLPLRFVAFLPNYLFLVQPLLTVLKTS